MRSVLCPKRDVAAALCAFLLLFGMSWPTSADAPTDVTANAPTDTPAAAPAAPAPNPPTPNAPEKHLTALMLVARSELPDDNFADSTVLVMNNLGPAPVGVIINRPTKILVSHLFPDLKRLEPVHDKVYFGGPVELDSVWFLVRASKPPEHAIQALDGVYISADKDLLMRLLGRDKPMDGLKIFLGHAGWAPDQLQAEIAHGDWTLQHAQAEAIFHSKSEHPWPAPAAPKNGT